MTSEVKGPPIEVKILPGHPEAKRIRPAKFHWDRPSGFGGDVELTYIYTKSYLYRDLEHYDENNDGFIHYGEFYRNHKIMLDKEKS